MRDSSMLQSITMYLQPDLKEVYNAIVVILLAHDKFMFQDVIKSSICDCIQSMILCLYNF